MLALTDFGREWQLRGGGSQTAYATVWLPPNDFHWVAGPLMQSTDRQRIVEVCSPCSHYIEPSLECRLLYAAGESYLAIFEDKECQPRLYLIRFLSARLRRTRETNIEDRAEDLAQTVISSLYSRDGNPSFLSRDLIGQRRFLAARAQQILIDERRRVEGRVRCGNCRHHGRGLEGGRVCRHPSGDHPWTGRSVMASEDPRTFDPPCRSYEARLGPKSLEETPPGWEPASSEPDALGAMEENERLSILSGCFASVQRDDPEGWNILSLFYFQKTGLAEIAKMLGTSSKTVLRRKARALDRLRDELSKHGIEEMGDVL